MLKKVLFLSFLLMAPFQALSAIPGLRGYHPRAGTPEEAQEVMGYLYQWYAGYDYLLYLSRHRRLKNIPAELRLFNPETLAYTMAYPQSAALLNYLQFYYDTPHVRHYMQNFSSLQLDEDWGVCRRATTFYDYYNGAYPHVWNFESGRWLEPRPVTEEKAKWTLPYPLTETNADISLCAKDNLKISTKGLFTLEDYKNVTELLTEYQQSINCIMAAAEHRPHLHFLSRCSYGGCGYTLEKTEITMDEISSTMVNMDSEVNREILEEWKAENQDLCNADQAHMNEYGLGNVIDISVEAERLAASGIYSDYSIPVEYYNFTPKVKEYTVIMNSNRVPKFYANDENASVYEDEAFHFTIYYKD